MDRNEYSRKWRLENREKVKGYARKYRQANPEKRKEYIRKWKAANPERVREYYRKYHLANPEKNREAQRIWRAKDPEKCRRNNTLKNRIWRANNPEKPKEAIRKFLEKNPEYNKQWKADHPERVKECARKWKGENIEKVRKFQRKWKKHKRQTDPNWKLTENMRSGMNGALKGRHKATSTMKIIGCTAEGLFKHLESCVSWKPWMTRENYGAGGWDVDHIIAITKWNYECPLQFIACWDKSNLQPMEHIENIKKGAK